MWSHPLWCLDHQNQNPKQYICLDLHRVLFFSFFFSKLSTWSSCGHHHDHHLLHHLHVPTSLSLHTLSIEVSTRVSSIIQNQTRAFNHFLVLAMVLWTIRQKFHHFSSTIHLNQSTAFHGVHIFAICIYRVWWEHLNNFTQAVVLANHLWKLVSTSGSQLTGSGKFHFHWPSALAGLRNARSNRFGTGCTELHCTSEPDTHNCDCDCEFVMYLWTFEHFHYIGAVLHSFSLSGVSHKGEFYLERFLMR